MNELRLGDVQINIVESNLIPLEPKGYKMPALPWASDEFRAEYKQFLIDIFGGERPVYLMNTSWMKNMLRKRIEELLFDYGTTGERTMVADSLTLKKIEEIWKQLK